MVRFLALDKNDEICGYEFIHLGKFMDLVKKGVDANEALKQVTGTYGRFSKEAGAVKYIDPRLTHVKNKEEDYYDKRS